MAYKRPINPDDPYDPQAPVDEPAPEGPAAPTDPYAPVSPTAPPPTSGTGSPTAPKPPGTSPTPGFDQYGQPQTVGETPPPTATARDTSGWNTGGYAIPGYTSTAYNPNAVSGYDPAKWADPLHQTPKYVVGRILSQYNLNDPTQLQSAMADIAKAYPGTTWAGKDVVNIPGIGNVDVIRDFGGESGIAWQPEDQGGGALTTHGTLGGGSLGTGSALTSSAASSSLQPWFQQGMTPYTPPAAPTSGSGSPALDDARRAALLELLGRQPPTAEELRNTPENQAYMLQAQRAEERQRAELAERAAYEGFGNSGYFDTELQGIRQQRGEGEAGFLGELAVSRMQAQREDLQFAISEAQQAGQFDLAQQLQREQMTLDAAIRREQIASSDKQAANDLALREFLGKAGIDLDRLRLGEDQRQFNYDLGFRYTNLDENRRQFDLDTGIGR
jgi:hypothetical protein